MEITEENFTFYATMNYRNSNILDVTEFEEDLLRFKYLRKLFNIYRNKGVLRERLILNHLIILYNVFETKSCTRMLFFKLEEYLDCLSPFLYVMGYMPRYVDLNGKNFVTKDIVMDQNVAKILQQAIYQRD